MFYSKLITQETDEHS